MSAPQAVLDLIERFDRNLEAYRSGQYKETPLRRDFIDPFFKALGWDIDNEQGFAEAYREVVHEDTIRVGCEHKAPDYSFRVGGTRKFFLEAKKPSIDIKGDPNPAYQLRRYAWSAKLPLSILTDFEEFAVYDCRIRPLQTDKPSTARVMYLTFNEYADRWEELYGLFSKNAVLKGDFDRYVASTTRKRGTAEVDDAFLSEIETWRDELARNIAIRNTDLSQREVNFAVGRTIDRIIFLRICEDRGIEEPNQLMALQNGTNVYRRLIDLYHRADEKYNSGLFHFRKERDRPLPPDELTLKLNIDDKVLKDIFKGLYYPDSPYEFSVLPADILGQVYEQFLGKVIRLTPAHHAKVEDKPEVKKAGGVYYTPTYIVDYIVKHTVGKLLEGKIPKDVGANGRSPIRILDPACGSGSFLLGAYQLLLDWHRDRYVDQLNRRGTARRAPTKQFPIYQVGENDWRLTTAERKRILLNNIYGVDIDPQAVEVTKLSLLLKVLEEESAETINRQLKLLHERALPDLAGNIKCGNSLIGPDFYEGRQLDLLDEEERLRINVFDWEAEFPEIMHPSSGSGGGFDAVIGNPPYIRIQVMREWAPVEVGWYGRHYEAASAGSYDIYVIFVEKGLSVLTEHGILGFILPTKFFSTDYGASLRKLISQKQALTEVVDFHHHQIFEGSTTYTCLLFLNGRPTKSTLYVEAVPVSSNGPLKLSKSIRLQIPTGSDSPWLFQSQDEENLVEIIMSRARSLEELPTKISRGSSTGADDVFIFNVAGAHLVTKDGQNIVVEPEILRIPIYATDFSRFVFRPANTQRILFPYVVREDGYQLMEEKVLKTEFPKAYKYLQSRKNDLLIRKQFRMWYSFSAPRNLEIHDKAQMFVPLLADRGLFCFLPSGGQTRCLMASAGFSLTTKDTDLSPKYVLGLLNSKLLFWRLKSISNVFRGGWITCTKQYVKTLPIRTIDFSDPSDKACHDKMVSLVERMLALHKELAKARTEHEQTALQRQIDATDRQIDRLVYELYGLAEEEVGIVEGS